MFVSSVLKKCANFIANKATTDTDVTAMNMSVDDENTVVNMSYEVEDTFLSSNSTLLNDTTVVVQTELLDNGEYLKVEEDSDRNQIPIGVKPRKSILACFDPLYVNSTLDGDNELEVLFEELPLDGTDVISTRTFAEAIVNSLIDSAVHTIEDSLFIENNITSKSQDDMAAMNNKIEAYEDETSRLKLLLQQKEMDEVLLREKVQKLEDEILTKSNTPKKEIDDIGASSKMAETKLINELKKSKTEEVNYKKVMSEYEKVAAEQFAKLQKLEGEHDTAKLHLANLELAFADLLKKYERSKEIITGFKNNEDTLRENICSSDDLLKNSDQKYESLKSHARSQVDRASQEIQIMRDQHDSEVLKLNAIVKKLEIKNNSLSHSLEQKINECTALAALCDEFTGKV